MFSKLFKEKNLDSKLSDIYIVYRILFVLMNEKKLQLLKMMKYFGKNVLNI